MLKVGDPAPGFEGTTASGAPFSLESTRGRPLVLYFYPKARTTGCTIEAREFAKHYDAFREGGVSLVGVSVDTVETQRRFSDECALPFPLIADRTKEVTRRYGVLGLLGLPKRVTFFVGADGRIEEIVEGLRPGPHIQRALERLRTPPTSEPTAPPPGGTPP
jgi:thioredoxin-dependent peroxiredoxin